MKTVTLTDEEYSRVLEVLMDMIFYFVNDPACINVKELNRQEYLKEAKKLKGIYNKLLGSEFFKELEKDEVAE